MFGRSSWAIIGLSKESLASFQAALEEPALMAASSQMAAQSIARIYGSDALGINPFSAPRLDEQQPLGPELQGELARCAIAGAEDEAQPALPAEILAGEGYAFTAERYALHPTLPWYGLWAVSNEWKKTSDLASIKEDQSYRLLERPYRFLQAADRKTVDQETLTATTLTRKQVPVLLDFNEGRVYIENTNKKLIYSIIVRLNKSGADTFPVAWRYSPANWTEEILNRLHANSRYQDEFMKRAEEARRFQSNEIEKLEDRELERIVANYFSMTELPGGLWAALSAPARIRLHETTPPIGVRAPVSATALLHATAGASISTAALTIQEQAAVPGSEHTERRVRRDLLRVELNDRINLTDVGAAMLRGFDVAARRKEIQREIRRTKQVPSIAQFWANWLHELSNAVRTLEGAFREVLDLDGGQDAGILPLEAAEREEVLDPVRA